MEYPPWDDDFEEQQLAWQPGCTVTLMQPDIVLKRGAKVRPNEETAMRLANEYAPGIPIPKIYMTSYKTGNGPIGYGELYMSTLPGISLHSVWAGFDDATKLRICRDLMALPVLTLWSAAILTLRPLLSMIRHFELAYMKRYVANNGLSYRDPPDLRDLLPRSDISVFTHGDIGPRNILVDEAGHISGLLDWESSGWFPDYWEMAQIIRHGHGVEHDWPHWMTIASQEQWDLTGIQKARRVLF
ncbi:uncharacterized protein E0L32_003934 [Thyridium curvatum]|uniref:Aminoglycoside phosphotransferase domain-containing protein n=1 Tax=Thyridium curvatum TaxID=1093900 RepID=A0A507AZL8_9PEZI|nr:uncharacterized protein E0L32_003934 [Thyridium curvatum]TPX16285.1 hypothetical protein E0L32_003934 [Thyridium curvatum]